MNPPPPGNSLAVQGLGFCTLTAEGPGSIPSGETKIPQVAWPKEKKERKPHHNKQFDICPSRLFRIQTQSYMHVPFLYVTCPTSTISFPLKITSYSNEQLH